MIYLSGAITPTLVNRPRPDLGVMLNPGGNRGAAAAALRFLPWAADNGCFALGDRFDSGEWLEWLASLRPWRASCLFAVAPDVLCDWSATWERSEPFLPTIRQLGFKAALVAQNGMPLRMLDLAGFDALFIGGDDAFKLSEHAYALAAKAKRQGRWVHMGRVNSLRRLRAARVSAFDSADGTFVRYAPDRHLPTVYDWLDIINGQEVLV